MTENTDNLFDLSEFASDWTNADISTMKQGFKDAPDGKYVVKVHKVGLDRTQKGDKRLNWQLKIASGDFTNKLLFKSHLLKTKDNIKFLKADLVTLALNLDSITELPDRLKELLDKVVEVTKKSRKDDAKYYDIYFNALLDAVPDGDQSTPDDETPF